MCFLPNPVALSCPTHPPTKIVFALAGRHQRGISSHARIVLWKSLEIKEIAESWFLLWCCWCVGLGLTFRRRRHVTVRLPVVSLPATLVTMETPGVTRREGFPRMRTQRCRALHPPAVWMPLP